MASIKYLALVAVLLALAAVAVSAPAAESVAEVAEAEEALDIDRRAAKTVTIAAKGVKFGGKANLITKIKAGTTVMWTGLRGHNVRQTPGNPTCTAADIMANGFLSPHGVATFSYKFTTPGTYHYRCDPHCRFGMTGTIIVS